MKTDTQLKSDVIAELEWDPAINASRVGVAVTGGVVTLTGHLGSFAEKRAAEHAAQRVAGVRAVAVELDVVLEPDHRRSDTELATAIETAFRWHAQIPDDRLQFTVERGCVTVTGEVDWDFQRHNVDVAVQAIDGVVALNNRITLRPREAPTHVVDRIRDALARYGAEEARRIRVDVKDGTVTLTGTVNSIAEREVARAAAVSAVGIARVVNELSVAV